MRVSSPEATALDLVRYVGPSGHIGNVSTVLGTLAESLDGKRLVEAARADVELSAAQRLGLLLDRVGATRVTEGFARWVREQRPRPVLLRPDRPAGNAPRDERWLVIVNEMIEPDE